MSNCCRQSPAYVDLRSLRENMEKCIQEGLASTQAALEQLLDYYVSGLVRSKSNITYNKSIKWWTIEFVAEDHNKNEYVYKFFIKD